MLELVQLQMAIHYLLQGLVVVGAMLSHKPYVALEVKHEIHDISSMSLATLDCSLHFPPSSLS